MRLNSLPLLNPTGLQKVSGIPKWKMQNGEKIGT
jgi:hypothetical protein